nr:hypothetical protein BdHM001_35870 [Bdellovibrio sp. HM001]
MEFSTDRIGTQAISFKVGGKDVLGVLKNESLASFLAGDEFDKFRNCITVVEIGTGKVLKSRGNVTKEKARMIAELVLGV